MGNKAIEINPSGSAWGWSLGIEDRYRPMIAKLERLSQEKPKAYRGKVIRRALMGYGFIGLVL
ncbi:MAG: hypothetical protein B7Z26_03445, partial [Asticcacaulis sp. 32-58-5]